MAAAGILETLTDAQEFAFLWLLSSGVTKLRDRCERCARVNSIAEPARLCEQDARALIWLTATENGAPGSERLAELDPETFDDLRPNALALLIDGTGVLARHVINIWRRASPEERRGAIADLPRGTYSREAQTAAATVRRARAVAGRAAAAFTAIERGPLGG